MKPTTVRDLLKKLVSDAPGLSRAVKRGRREAFANEGTNSLFMGPVAWAAKKVKGKDAVEKALYDKWQRPIKNVDEKAGKALADAGIAPSWWRHVDALPTGRKMGGNKAFIEHETHSVTAPIAKASKAATPLLAAIALGDIAGKMENMSDAKELAKEAADKLAAYAVREEAEKVAFALVEQRMCKPFSSFEEFDAKVASIVETGPDVVKAAMELKPTSEAIGTLSQEKTAEAQLAENPTAAFFHRLSQ